MTITEQQHKEFEAAARPLIEYLTTAGFHPHVTVIVDNTSAQLVEGVATVHTTDYTKD
jgi:2'-5' RNA ligase